MGENSVILCLVLRGYKLSEPLEEGDFAGSPVMLRKTGPVLMAVAPPWLGRTPKPAVELCARITKDARCSSSTVAARSAI
jgi:hypothetical protein